MSIERKDEGENVLGEELAALFEESMGPMGLKILESYGIQFLFPDKTTGEQDDMLEMVRKAKFVKSVIKSADRQFINYNGRASKHSEIHFVFIFHNGRVISVLTGGKKDIPVNTEEGTCNHWEINANYQVGPEPNKEIQFSDGSNSYVSGESGIMMSTQSWYRVKGGTRPVVVFNVHRGDEMVEAIELPISSVQFPGGAGVLIPSPKNLPPLENVDI